MKLISMRSLILMLTCFVVWSLTPASGVFADVDEPYKGGLLSLKGEKWEIGGELEAEFRNAQEDASTPYSEFRIDQFYLIPKVKFNNISLKAEIQVTDSKTIMEEAHATFSGLPGKAFIKAGLEDRFIKRSRVTETYPLIGSAFWRDDDLGIQIGGKSALAYWFLSYTNGLRVAKSATSLTTQKVAEDSGAKFLHEDRNVSDMSENKELGVGLGRKQDLGRFGKADLLVFTYFGGLSADEISALNTLPGYSSTEDEKNLRGVRLTHKWKNLQLVGEVITAKTGDLRRRGWYLEPSYKIKTPWSRPKSFTLLLRYNELYNGLPRTPGNVLTWDWRVYTLASIVEIQKHVKLKLEYNIVDEATGSVAEVDNNEFLAQLELKF